jgi:hypothetical protein
MLPTVADLRARIAYQQIMKYVLAAEVGVHPGRLASMLSGQLPMPPAVRDRVIEALSAREQEAVSAG